MTEAHQGTCWLPTPYAPAELCSTGAASTLPATTPARHPARAGQPTRLRYATTTWAGLNPMHFSTPIRV